MKKVVVISIIFVCMLFGVIAYAVFMTGNEFIVTDAVFEPIPEVCMEDESYAESEHNDEQEYNEQEYSSDVVDDEQYHEPTHCSDVIDIPQYQEPINVSLGVDAGSKQYLVSQKQCFTVECSYSDCIDRYSGSLFETRFSNAVNYYAYSIDNDDALISFNISEDLFPCYGGAVTDKYFDIGDVIECRLDDYQSFYFLVLDLKNTNHKARELGHSQVQCDYGHGYIVSDVSVQLNPLEFVVTNKASDCAANYHSYTDLVNKNVTSMQVVNHVVLD